MKNRAGGEDEFVVFVTEARGRLTHTAWLLTTDHHLSEELVQEALVRT